VPFALQLGKIVVAAPVTFCLADEEVNIQLPCPSDDAEKPHPHDADAIGT